MINNRIEDAVDAVKRAPATAASLAKKNPKTAIAVSVGATAAAALASVAFAKKSNTPQSRKTSAKKATDS